MSDHIETPAPGVEFRYYDDELDEVVIQNATLVHLEEMDHGQWWLGVTTADGTALINLGAVNTKAKKYAIAEWEDR